METRNKSHLMKEYDVSFNLWKERVNLCRNAFKDGQLNGDDVNTLELYNQISELAVVVKEIYDDLLKINGVNGELAKKQNVCDVVTLRMKAKLCKQSSDTTSSIGRAVTKMYEDNLDKVSSVSHVSRSSRIREAEVELATKQIEAESLKKVQIQRSKLAELQAKMEEEKMKLEELNKETEIRVAEAKLNLLSIDNCDGKSVCEINDECSDNLVTKMDLLEVFSTSGGSILESNLDEQGKKFDNTYNISCQGNNIYQPNQTRSRIRDSISIDHVKPVITRSHTFSVLNPNVPAFTPSSSNTFHDNPQKVNVCDERQAPVSYGNHGNYNPQAVYRLHNLPAVEPTVFTGDSLQYIKWKLSFQTLIESRGLSAAERMFYLQRYLGGNALKAVENFFYSTTEESYQSAWNLLNERYGHPFVIQEAFRQKLANWPRIKYKNSTDLQGLADYLRACQDAMSHIDGLAILNDCKENQRIVSKLPDDVASRWNREVTYTLERGGSYPSFAKFVQFVTTEAKIACNPITSFSALKSNDRDSSTGNHSNEVKAKSISLVTASDKSQDSSRVCFYCKEPTHFLNKCSELLNLPLEDRKAFVMREKLCFGCLKPSHQSKDCPKKHTCQICKKPHPTLLHNNRNFRLGEKEKESQTRESSTKARSFKVNSTVGSHTSMIVPVWISANENSNKEVLTYAMLDNQSDSTFVLEDLVNSVKLDSTPVKLKLTTMTSKSEEVTTKAVSNLVIRGMNSNKRLKIPVSYTKDYIPADIVQIPTSSTALNWNHLADIVDEIPVLQDCKIGLLVGNNCPQALIPRDTRTGHDDEPYGVKTDLGWSIVGGDNSSTEVLCNRIHVVEQPQLNPRDVINVLQADFKDTQVGEKTVSQEDLRFIEIMKNNIEQGEDGHYVMPLPFKKEMPQMPENKKQALARLNFLKRKFISNPKYFNDYKAFMDEIMDRGDVELASEASENAWYIPHHGVYHPKKPNKIRVVFDCSATYERVSLNQLLLTGPDLINSLTGVLCRFRQHPVAFMCDIKKMFHQFLVDRKHRDYLRFLWWENGDPNNKILEYRMKVHLFGAASSPGCANFALKHHAKVHEKLFPEAARFIEEDFYVDDGLHSCETQEQAITLIEDTRNLCQRGGLFLHKFLSNNANIAKLVNQSETNTSEKVKDINLCEESVDRALGIQWQTESDVFIFTSQPVKIDVPTRRSILSTVAGIYDPLGFISPFVLEGKSILQEMCKAGTSWDDPLPSVLQSRWESWNSDCSNLQNIKIPRCYRPSDMEVERYELHHFSDGSTSGYGQCSYLRIIGKNDVHCTLIASKSRVAPTKITTIPRLELTAACVSAQMSNTLRSELTLPISKEYFWTDSKIVLSYINNDAKRFQVFVANRITQIRQLTDPKQWYYIPTNENPADHASRGMTVHRLLRSNWYDGPKFLWDKTWNVTNEKDWPLTVGDPEVKKIKTLKTSVSTKPNFKITEYLERVSSWSKAVSVVAWIRRISNGIRLGKKPLSNEERQEASNYILMSLQRNEFSEDIEALRNGCNVRSTSPLNSLDPLLDDSSIVRVGGRLSKSDIAYNTKHPVILPNKSHITDLLVRHYHEEVKHQGRGITQNEVRSNGFWIISGSRTVQNIIKRCVTCRKLRRPTEEQKMANLPDDRTEPSAPFSFCGMDCFGPYIIKKGRQEIKRYGLIITCLCCRGIHIEMLDDMSTDALINALRCFIAIRGHVRQIRCDQGSNFIGAKNEFEAAGKPAKLEQFLSEKQCEFLLNSPSSSHAGGVWERQIRTVRSILDATILLSNGRLDDASLRTFFYEAMSIVNSRPLTVDSINDQDAPEPLTPNHLITMKSKVALPPPGQFVKEDLYITKRWRRVQYLTEVFWGRWRKEYLLSLNKRAKWNQPRRNMKVGDIVLLKDENIPRSVWPLGIITQTLPSADGLVRKVKVKISNKSVLERPIQRVVLLVESNNKTS